MKYKIKAIIQIEYVFRPSGCGWSWEQREEERILESIQQLGSKQSASVITFRVDRAETNPTPKGDL